MITLHSSGKKKTGFSKSFLGVIAQPVSGGAEVLVSGCHREEAGIYPESSPLGSGTRRTSQAWYLGKVA